jgi:hypothetical protein
MDRGDLRMNMAVAARIRNPDLSLYECLTFGGFVYSGDNGACVDNQNVTLSQRKNQLNRRLRRAQNQSKGNRPTSWNGKRKIALQTQLEHLSSNLTTSEDATKAFAPPHEISFSSFGTTAMATPMTEASFSFPHSDESHVLDAPLTPNLPDESTTKTTSTSTTDTTALPGEPDPRQELALSYFEREPHALYQRCMISAGFSVEECLDMSSDAYRKFAFQAWKRECERLQALMARHSEYQT